MYEGGNRQKKELTSRLRAILGMKTYKEKE
jgi:hypothetical protein